MAKTCTEYGKDLNCRENLVVATIPTTLRCYDVTMLRCCDLLKYKIFQKHVVNRTSDQSINRIFYGNA